MISTIKKLSYRNLNWLQDQIIRYKVRYNSSKAVDNINSWHLSDSVETVLKGLEFKTTNQQIPYIDLIDSLKVVVSKLPKHHAN